MKKIYFLISFLIIFSLDLFSQTTPGFVSDSIDNYICRAMNNWQIPGAAVLIVKDGKIVFEKGFGVKELGKDDLVDKNTLFMIGSNTKAFTGTALALLEHDEKLKLDDKVIQYLPEFKMKDEWVNKELNLLDIVSHRMGLETFQGDFIYWTSDLTSDEVIEKFGKLTPKFNFRTKYGYTNAGYVIAGKIIEKVSGLSWDEFLKEKIFRPLEMSRTVPLFEDFVKSDNIAKPHTYIDGKISLLQFQNIDNLAPAGSIGSSVNDLAHWVIAQLDSGKYDSIVAIPFSAIQKTRQMLSIERRVRHPYNKTHYSLYGMGWEFQDYEGKEIISHTGGVNGFVTSVTLLPEENLGIVVLTNTDQNTMFMSLKWEILDAYLHLPYRNYDSSFYAGAMKRKSNQESFMISMKDSVKLNLSPEIDLKHFAGRYENDVYGYADLVQKENFLELSLEHHSRLTGKLEYIGNNRFLCTYSDPTYGIKVFPFEIIEGKINSFDLYVDDFIEFLPYKFSKEIIL